MSNIDKQQIRDDIASRKSMPGFGVSPDHSLARLKAIQETQRSFGQEVVEALLDELEAKDKRIAEQREIMRQAASDISYAIFNLTGSDLSRLQPGVIETTDPTDTALIAERSLRAAAAGKGE